MPKCFGKNIFVGIVIFYLPLAEAQKSINVPGQAQRPQLDGQIEAAEWAGAARIDQLHQVAPVEFADPSEATYFLLMYDEDFLYVAGRAFESPRL